MGVAVNGDVGVCNPMFDRPTRTPLTNGEASCSEEVLVNDSNASLRGNDLSTREVKEALVAYVAKVPRSCTLCWSSHRKPSW